jgi:ATP-dependent RNA helicase DeaD
MTPDALPSALSPAIAGALAARGFTSLTSVQHAVLDPALQGRDLRISSQTGSGKTVAVGFVLAPDIEHASNARAAQGTGPACPTALLIAPTRELAAQIARELSWLFAPFGSRICTLAGGGSVAADLRNLRKYPHVIVATPGRLLDHLQRGSIHPGSIAALVLDEADQLLDLGFREELDRIVGQMPPERRTHLVSATFSRDVLSLADSYQKEGVHVKGTNLGEAHEDISHVAHLVRPQDRDAALINLLLLSPAERALVFVRTRADASDLADRLASAGLRARALSGDLEQWERSKTLEAFRNGQVTTLVATDVAARGIDVPDVGRVIHADLPGDAELFTHRSGRTGRAGQQGTSILLVPPQAREHVLRLFRRARVEGVWKRPPSPADVLDAADQRLRAELSDAAPGSAAGQQGDRLRPLAEALLAEMDPTELVTALLARAHHTGPCAPLPLTPIDPPPPPRPARPLLAAFVPFRINWGERSGADPRRLLALVCRRGGIKSCQIGTIRIGPTASVVEVAEAAAPDFARSVKKPDSRDPRIRIDPVEADGARSPTPPPRRRNGPPARGSAPPRRGIPRWN